MQNSHFQYPPYDQPDRNRPVGSGIRKVLLMLAENWYFFVLSIMVFGVGAYFYLRHTIPVHRVSTTMLMVDMDHNRLGSGMQQNALLEGFVVSPGAVNLDNQIMLLKSRTLLRNTLQQLDFGIDVYRKGLRRSASYYPVFPIRVVPGPGDLPYENEFSFEYISDEIFRLTSEGGIEVDTVVPFGNRIEIAGGSFTVLPNPDLERTYRSDGKIYFIFRTIDQLVPIYRSRLIIKSATDDGSVIEISLEGTNRTRDMIFLDMLTEVYLAVNLEKKNHEASRIVQFIDNLLVDVSDSLAITENQLQDFRSRNRIMDVSAQGTQIINQAVELENEKARLTLESQYYDYLDEYLSREQNREIPNSPTAMGIEDPILTGLMQELAGLQAAYSSSSGNERNPLHANLEQKIDNTKQSIRETLEGIMQANEMAIQKNEQQISSLNAQASALPEKERQLLGIERRFNLNNVLYNYLMQKRAEAQIQKASNRPDNELIDPAAPVGLVSPVPVKTYGIAVSLGIVLPFLILFLGNVVNYSIRSEDDLKMITSLPIVGHIPHSRLSYNTVVLTETHSRISEAFRSLRTRMEFFTKDTRCPVILVSSSMPGEGKTFVAINLASAYSLAGKKTLLVGFDLRRPNLSKSFQMNGEIGLSTFLIGKFKDNSIIYATDYPNLYLIPSGPVPPNASELANSDRSRELLSRLKSQFDYIIIDTAPIGTVADNYAIADEADAVLMVVRDGYTKKSHLNATLQEMHSTGIKGASILINDFKLRKSAYRYTYKYKYGDVYTKSRA